MVPLSRPINRMVHVGILRISPTIDDGKSLGLISGQNLSSDPSVFPA